VYFNSTHLLHCMDVCNHAFRGHAITALMMGVSLDSFHNPTNLCRSLYPRSVSDMCTHTVRCFHNPTNLCRSFYPRSVSDTCTRTVRCFHKPTNICRSFYLRSVCTRCQKPTRRQLTSSLVLSICAHTPCDAFTNQPISAGAFI